MEPLKRPPTTRPIINIDVTQNLAPNSMRQVILKAGSPGPLRLRRLDTYPKDSPERGMSRVTTDFKTF
jgi:hypothetical protein